MPRLRRILLGLLGILLVFNDSFAVDRNLFERLGGMPEINRISSMLIERARHEPLTRRSFHKVNIRRLKRQVGLQLCALTGGPCHYSGDTMREIHAGLHITEGEFYGFVEELRDILDEERVGTREKNELLALLAPMKKDVVLP